jgi:ribose 5-phosphate isomerase B
MRIIIGADHAGFPLKGTVVDALRAWGHEVEDVGTHSTEPVDFPQRHHGLRHWHRRLYGGQ